MVNLEPPRGSDCLLINGGSIAAKSREGSMSNSSRRGFFRDSTIGALTAWTLHGQSANSRILIAAANGASFRRTLARNELLRGLTRFGIPNEVRFSEAAHSGAAGRDRGHRAEGGSRAISEFRILYDCPRRRGPIDADGRQRECAAVCRLHEFLERQGAFFGIDGDQYPLDPPHQLMLPAADRPWTSSPASQCAGFFPGPTS